MQASEAVAAKVMEGVTNSLRLRVVTYNVLSSHLAQPAQYPTFPPEHLEAKNRLPVVLNKLQAEIDSNKDSRSVIFCLQEVSYDWAGTFHTFFANQGYHMVTGLYGKKFNGYMGVALAWPTQEFKTLNVDISRLSDRRESWPRPPRTEESFLTLAKNKIYNPLAATVWGGVMRVIQLPLLRTIVGYKPSEAPTDHWSVSEWRLNVMLTATLCDKASGKAFCVGTYHMPCAYYAPMIMTIHVDLAANHIQKLAAAGIVLNNDDEVKVSHKDVEETEASNKEKPDQQPCLPYILAGDFNIKPTDSTYTLLSTGKMNSNDPNFPTSKYNYSWTPSLREPLQSAYAQSCGHEPDFTNFARMGDIESECFIDTLDYIWLSPSKWNVDSVLAIPNRKDAKGPFPNLDVNEPSDHVLIAADLTLENA